MPGERYTFDREQTRRIRAAVLDYENTLRDEQILTERALRGRTAHDTAKWYPCYNAGATTITAHGLVAMAAPSLLSGRWHWNVRRPDTTFTRFYGVCGFRSIAAGERGAVAISGMVRVAYDTGTPAYGDEYGAKPSQFTASKGYPGCLNVHGVVDGTNKIMLAELHPINKIIGKLSGTLSQGSSATVNVWESSTPGTEAVITSMTVTGRDWLMKSGATAIASGKKVVVEWINGVPYVTEGECA